MTNAQNSKTVAIVLAGKDFVVRRVPMARVKMVATLLTEVFKDLDLKEAQKNPEQSVSMFVDRLLEAPHAILSVFIRDLPKEIFHDEDDGVDFPEFLDALNIAIELNRLDVLKNGFSRLFPVLLEAQKQQASISRRRS